MKQEMFLGLSCKCWHGKRANVTCITHEFREKTSVKTFGENFCSVELVCCVCVRVLFIH